MKEIVQMQKNENFDERDISNAENYSGLMKEIFQMQKNTLAR